MMYTTLLYMILIVGVAILRVSVVGILIGAASLYLLLVTILLIKVLVGAIVNHVHLHIVDK